MTFPTGGSTPLFSTPYLTVDEYLNAPTAVDIDDLVDGGDEAANRAELANVIARASSLMDGYCFQVLAATEQTEQIRMRISPDRALRLSPRYFPVREVTALSIGSSPALMAPIVLTDDSIWIEPQSIEIIGAGPAGRIGLSGRSYVSLTYVAGYANTILTAAVTAATTLPLADVTGILPGDQIGVYDVEAGTQPVEVASSWVSSFGPGNVPIVTPATGAKGGAVSALPPAVKEAAIDVVSSLLKGRGSTAIEMSSLTSVGSETASDPAGPDLAAAREILLPYRRVR